MCRSFFRSNKAIVAIVGKGSNTEVIKVIKQSKLQYIIEAKRLRNSTFVIV